MPLNGTKTHPLKPPALQALRYLLSGPVPRSCFNPGVVDRLTRDDEMLAEVVDLTSPYTKDRGKARQHLRITDAGRAAVNGKEGGTP